MKSKILVSLVIILTLLFSVSKACIKNIRIDNIEINGFELAGYTDINTFKKGDFTSSILDIDDKLVYTRYEGEIQIEVYMAEKDFFPLDVIHTKIINIFNLASEHLQEHFVGLIVNRKLYMRILACCVEYGMRSVNTLFRELRTDINCVNKLGLDGSKKDIFWIANKWDEGDIFEIIL